MSSLKKKTVFLRNVLVIASVLRPISERPFYLPIFARSNLNVLEVEADAAHRGVDAGRLAHATAEAGHLEAGTYK